MICSPKWISESLQAGKLLDYTNYLLYSNASSSQPKLNFAKAKDAKNENFLGTHRLIVFIFRDDDKIFYKN